jgi:putative flavoprotein involved in K+ transport
MIRRLLSGALVLFGVALADSPSPTGVPLPNAHSHNDYLRPRPLLDALDQGFCGVEADVFLVDGDLLVAINTLPVLKRILKTMTARMVEFDRKLIDGLIARGFKWYDGDDHLGHNMLIRTRYGGYNLDGGCSELIVKGEVGLLQFERIERFAPGGALLKDGSLVPADLIVLGTGFEPQQAVVKKLLGEAIAEKIGPVWGLGPDGEMNNMWKRTAQEGLWFAGGSFSNCRIFSRFVALQIKAIEEGLVPK